jgi:hypothetical protein
VTSIAVHKEPCKSNETSIAIYKKPCKSTVTSIAIYKKNPANQIFIFLKKPVNQM